MMELMTKNGKWTGYAPGRAEWLGNHTDYNDGLVLGLGLEVGATVSAEELAEPVLRMSAVDLGETCEVALDALVPQALGAWSNYVIGVADGFRRRGAELTGLGLSIKSTVPVGAGLSSSAALECSTGRALQQAWGTDFSDMELARIGQEAEHQFAGVRCGLLDQVTSLFARPGQAVFLDCRSLEVERVPVPGEARFVIVQSGVKHALSDGAYNNRREECEAAADVLGVDKLREATLEMVEAAASCGDLQAAPLRRARHVVTENGRVEAAVSALRTGDLRTVGRLMNESHESSRTQFENSCNELDYLAALARQFDGCYGARLSGGGFGGAIIAMVRAGLEENFVREIRQRVGAEWGREPECLISGAGG